MISSQQTKVDSIDGGASEPDCAAASEPHDLREQASILLVDDRVDKCMAMETILAELGEDLVTVHSGKDALRLLLDREFAVILLDVNMPGLDGFETALLIRQRQSLEHTPIIFITGISDTETHVSRGYSLGAVDYILTPVLPDVLRTKVSVFVELFKKNRQLQRQAEGLRRAHDELLDRTAELAATNQDLEAFTYSVAHDLQGPVRNIQGYIQLLETECDSQLPPDAGQYLKRIAARTHYMAQLISGLLNLSIIGKQELKRRQVELKAIVDEVVASLSTETPERRIQWKIQELPAQACDPDLMKQVFTNLLSNAVKYTRPRTDAVIEVGQTQVNGDVPIYVRDNGVGFNMQYADKLFGVFQRLHSATEFEGTGVGLATAERIVRKHGGRIWAEAEEENGATFYFTIGHARVASG